MTKCKREICDEELPVNDNHRQGEFCSLSCEKYHQQENCKHVIRLEGLKKSEDRDGFDRQRSIYYCIECKLDWEK